MSLLENIRKKIAKKVRHPSEKWSRLSYSQEGEDLLLDRILDDVKEGFYVEVGAHHPCRFSNTYLFYRKGWNGICIDPIPGTQEIFSNWRPRDVAVECGVSGNKGELTYYMFNESAFNTFDSVLAMRTDGDKHFKLIEQRRIATQPLSDILHAHLPRGQEITFLSVDVEGMDLEVLQSNDWDSYRPKCVIAECLDADLRSLNDDPIVLFLSSVGFRPYAKTGNSVIFRDSIVAP